MRNFHVKKSGKIHLKSLFGIIISIIMIASGCESSSDETANPTPSKPATPNSAPNIFIDGSTVTATWDAEPGVIYIIQYGNSPENTGAQSGVLDSSPATFHVHNKEGTYYFRILQIVNGIHSDPSVETDSAPFLPTPEISIINENSSGTTIEIANYSNGYDTGRKLYYGTSSSVTPDNGIEIGEIAPSDIIENSIEHQITEFLDSNFNPITYYYVARSYYSEGGIIKSVSDPSIKISSTPDLVRFRLYSDTGENPKLRIVNAVSAAKADGGLLEIAGDNAYWICHAQYSNTGGFCYTPLSPPGQPSTPQEYSLSQQPVAFTIESDGSQIYYLYKSPGEYVQPWRYLTDNSELGPIKLAVLDATADAVGIVQDNSYLYINTGKDIFQILKSAIASEITPFTTLLSGKNDIHAMVVIGTRLYYADDSGVHYLSVPGGTIPTAVTMPGGFGTVTSITGNSSIVFYIADDEEIPGAQAIFKVDTSTASISKIQERLYNAANLAYANANLYWIDNSKVYMIPESGGTVLGRVSEKTTTIAINETSNDLVFTPISNNQVHSVPSAYQFSPSAVSDTSPVTGTIIHDSHVELSFTIPENSVAVEVWVDNNYYANNPQLVRGLVNGTAHDISVVPVNISGAGTGATEIVTPTINWTSGAGGGISLDSDDGKIILYGQLQFPIGADGLVIPRQIRFNLFRDTAPEIDMSTAPWASFESSSDGYQYSTFNHDDVVANDVFYYYNATVTDLSFDSELVPNPTTSDPLFALGEEPYSNAATGGVELLSTWGPGEHKKYLTYALGNLYWMWAGSPYAGFKWDSISAFDHNSFLDQSSNYFTGIVNWQAITSDGSNLYGGGGTTGGLEKIVNIDATPDATFFTSENAYYANGVFNSILYDNSYIYFATNTGKIIRTKTDDSSSDLLCSDCSSSVGNLNISAGKLYWSQGVEIWRSDLSGDTKELVYSVPDSITDLAIGSTQLYWKGDFSQIYTVALTGGAYTKIGAGGSVIVDPSTDAVYWNSGDIYTLDAQGRSKAICSSPSGAGNQILTILNNQIYTVGWSLRRCDRP